jgi:hypothetical protein
MSAHPTLTERLQQKCSDWGAYWRASDAHGVVLTLEQALELLRDALGVEVEFSEDLAGWKSVPLEPTQDMLYAMAECDGYQRGDRDHPMLTRWEDYWRVAIAAAPQEPQ